MKDEDLLNFIEKPKNIYTICAEFKKGYTTIYHKLNILKEEGKVKKIKTYYKTMWFKVQE